jgi:hypothetical protein
MQKPPLGGYLKELEFQNSEYKVHQVGPKDSGSQNFSFLALTSEPVDEVQIFAYGNGALQTKFFLSPKSCFYPLKVLKRENQK